MEPVQCRQKKVDAEAYIWAFHDENTALYLRGVALPPT